MLQIQQLTTDTPQQHTLVLPDGSQFSMQLVFVPMQYSWFIKNLTYGDFILGCVRISNSGNILRQFKNQIPFGLACFSTESREPSLQEDFSSGNSNLFILSVAEVKQYEDFIIGV